MISARAFFKSIKHAWRGIGDVFHAEQSFRIQVVIGAGVLGALGLLPFESWERILLVLLVVAVLVLEIINSTIERIADAVHPRMHPTIREMKDMMAGAVLLVSLTAAGIGCAIIVPPLFEVLCQVYEVPFFEKEICVVK